MTTEAEREELVRLVRVLMSAEGTEDEQDAVLSRLRAQVPHPRVSDLIYWPQSEGFDQELSAEEIVDLALAYRPIEL